MSFNSSNLTNLADGLLSGIDLVSIIGKILYGAAVVVPCLVAWHYYLKTAELQAKNATLETAYTQTQATCAELQKSLALSDQTIKEYAEQVKLQQQQSQTKKEEIKHVVKLNKANNDWWNTVVPDDIRVRLQQ